MIYIVTKELKIKKEEKEEFSKYIKNWIYISKQEELNLSIDGYWMSGRFIIFERWSSEESFMNFSKKDWYKDFLTSITKFTVDEMKVRKFKTVI
ncbi:antibiotic biosynthesis monooxygenase [Mycoplasma sp. HS2188]|uniref:antibiotic biosynthesis monooxygenase n=1 Tax=Mycoplasma sp. HS2188 TaxID=2976765 RepID=UPI0021AA0396|nr:antibiotic biosynthesis monooxygenase [Mycoplasma sp. HS2188]MCT4469908.1 hypothetical protein [Mycoplasma sp. HS2188]